MLEAATTPLPVLPEELVGEILLRLPVRSLLQFKCVCKSWKSLISESQFAKNHVQISTSDPTMTNQQLVFSHKESHRHREIVSYPLKPLFQNPSTPVKPGTFSYTEDNFHCIIGSCNGLLCVIDCFSLCIRICNPSLRLISNITSVPFPKGWLISHCGFGYDQVNDKYKLLLVGQLTVQVQQILTKIYTFGHDDSWKTIPNFPYEDHQHIRTFGEFVSGTLNWIVYSKNKILSFDSETETYMELLLPQNDGHNIVCKDGALSVLRDCLCVSDSENCDWVLWMMKEYGVVESWTKFIIIPYKKLIKDQPCFVMPLFISNNGVLMVIMDSQLILYNSNNGVALDPLIVMKLSFYPHIQCESLISPSCLNKSH